MVQKMHRSDQKELLPLINKYEKESNPFRKDRLKKGILITLEDTLETKEKGWLQKLLDFLSRYLRLDKTSNLKKASVERVINMYLNEI